MRDASASELNSLQAKLEHTQRLLDEQKKANQQILDRAAQLKKERVSTPLSDEMKQRFDATMKVVATQKKDNEKLTMRLQTIQREEIRLRLELSKAQTELRTANKAAAAGAAGGNKSNPPKAA